MQDAVLLRTGGVAAIVGSAFLIVFNLLHPRGADPSDADAFARMLAGADIWRVDHLGLFLGVWLLFGGFIALYQSLTAAGGTAASWARLAFGAVAVATAEFTVLIAIDGLGAQEVARGYVGASGAEATAALATVRVMENLTLPLFTGFILLNWAAGLLFGVSLSLSSEYPHWLGWVFIVLGAAMLAVVGIPFAVAGPVPVLLTVVFPILATVTTVFTLILGIYLYQKAGQAVTA